MDKLIVTCAITGGGSPEGNPYLPKTPKEQAQSALEAWRAGASVINIHARNPATGKVAHHAHGLLGVAWAGPSHVTAVGSLGVILESRDGGRTWTRVASGTTQFLMSIAWGDRQHGTAVGNKGIILNSGDGGRTWAAVSSPTDTRLHGVAYLNPRDGVAVGQLGTALVTGDGGTTWKAVASHTLNHLSGVFARPGTPACAVGWGGAILCLDNAQPAPRRER